MILSDLSNDGEFANRWKRLAVKEWYIGHKMENVIICKQKVLAVKENY